METVFSGIQPSGELHLGNYLGAVRTWVELQQSYRCFYCIVDYHAITQPYEPAEMPRRAREMAIDLLACGIDPERGDAVRAVGGPRAHRARLGAGVGHAVRRARPHDAVQGQGRAPARQHQRRASSPTRSCRPRTSCSTARPACPSARTSASTSSWRARSCGAGTPASATPSPSRSRCSRRRPSSWGSTARRRCRRARATPSACASPRRRSGTSCARPPPIRRACERTDPGNPDVCNIFTLHKFFSERRAPGRGARRLHHRRHRLHRLQEDAVRGAEGRPGADRGARRRAARATPERVDEILAAGAARARAGRARDHGARARAAGPDDADPRMTLRTATFAACAFAWRPRGGACSTRDDGSSARSRRCSCCSASVRAGDREAVFNRFGPRTRAHIEELLASAHKTGGRACCARRIWSRSAGCRPPGSRPGTAHADRDGDEAEVEVYSAAGDRQTVHLVREGKSWKVELPLRRRRRAMDVRSRSASA